MNNTNQPPLKQIALTVVAFALDEDDRCVEFLRRVIASGWHAL